MRRLRSLLDGPRVLSAVRGSLPLAVLMGVLLLAALYFVYREPLYLYTYNIFLLSIFGAVALNLLMGTVGLVSIGNAGFLAAGGFGVIIAMKMGLPFPWDIPFSGLLAAVIGVVIGLPAIRLRGLELALASLAGYYIIDQLAEIFQSRYGGGTAGYLISTLYASEGLNGSERYWVVTLLVLVALLLVAVARISRGRAGRAWRLIRDNELVAAGMGVPVIRYKLVAFALSSGIIGVQGALLAYFTGSVSFENYTLALAISYLAMVAIGGLDSIFGAVIGAGVVVALPIAVPNLIGMFTSTSLNPSDSASYSTILYGFAIVLATMTSQRGLAGAGRGILQLIRRRRAPGVVDENAVPTSMMAGQ
jgi:branched-chain amino acid transport system permease protein